MTSPPYHAYLDGQGNLDLIVLGHGAARSQDAALTSARIRIKRQFAAPSGGEMMVTASIKQPDLGHPDRPLARFLGAEAAGRGPIQARSTSWRISTASARRRAPCTAGELGFMVAAGLRCEAGPPPGTDALGGDGSPAQCLAGRRHRRILEAIEDHAVG